MHKKVVKNMKNTSKNEKKLEKKQIISIITLGCKVNQYESDSIANALSDLGYIVKVGLEYADKYILNTCAVTNEGERKSRGIISKILKINPDAQIYVCGCAMQYAPEKISEKKNIVYGVGVSNKMSIVEAVVKNKTGIKIYPIPLKYEDNMRSLQTRTRAFVKIQDGCNAFCSYCIIPYLRGRSRSRTLASISEELDSITSNEIVFAGVNLQEYGCDLIEKPSLVDVVKLMKNKSARFRFSSLEMGSVTGELLDVLAGMENFCPHFHLSMQSGSNSVLKRMNRKYTKDEYLRTIKEIRKRFPNAGITTDVIVGFPGETETEAEETKRTIAKADFFEMHIFPFSKREGTIASKMINQVDGETKRIRAKDLHEIAAQQKQRFLKKQIGLMVEVIVEKILKNKMVEGYAKNYVRVVVEGVKNANVGDIIYGIVERCDSDFVYAKHQKNSNNGGN